jgi:transposase-like protein
MKSTKPVAPIRHRRMTTSARAEAIALWKSGEMTVDQLAKKFKKNRTTLFKLFKDEGAVKGADAAITKARVETAVAAAIVDDATVIATRIRETKDEHYKMASGISKLTWQIIVAAKSENRPYGSVGGDLRALKTAAETLRITREERYAVLGINENDDSDEKDIPVLQVQELTAEDIYAMNRQRALEANQDLGLADIDDIESMGDEEGISDEDDRVEIDE